MSSVLVLYGTTEGQTATVAERVGRALHERGHDAAVVDASDDAAALDLEAYDAVVVGSSVHGGRQHRDVVEFVETHRESLSRLPTAFFQLSLTSAMADEADRARAAAYVEDFLEGTDWRPDRVARFGGALRYSKYGFLKRLVMKRLAKRATGDTDTARDYEYTDWDEVDAFTADFAAFVEGRLGERPPTDETAGRAE